MRDFLFQPVSIISIIRRLYAQQHSIQGIVSHALTRVDLLSKEVMLREDGKRMSDVTATAMPVRAITAADPVARTVDTANASVNANGNVIVITGAMAGTATRTVGESVP
ncbi:hypothetical protein VTK56DRAFT_1617 [Thermocarpiscus australiensis]